MKSWTNFSTSLALTALLISGCAHSPRTQVQPGQGCVALLPPENLSGKPAPLQKIERGLAERLTAGGVRLWDETEMEPFLREHRLRYTGGIDRDTSRELRRAGVTSVLVTDVDLWSDSPPWKAGIMLRLVDTGDTPVVRASVAAAVSGDDAPGILGLGVAKDVEEVMGRVLDRAAASLLREMRGEDVERGERKIPPKDSYLSPVIDPGKKYTVAVLPFVNRTERRYAGDLITLQFVRELRRLPNVEVVEPGVVRQELLRYRVIMEEGVSLLAASVFFEDLQADLVLGGEVNDYEDPPTSLGAPMVAFSARALERRSRESVWSARSRRAGDDGVYFYDFGKINNASELAADLVRGAVATLAAGSHAPAGREEEGKK